MQEKTAPSRLQIGMRAPDLVLCNVQNQPVTLAEQWPTGPTLLTFLRHFG